MKSFFWRFFGVLLFVVCAPALMPQVSFTRGEELFMQNKPQEALKFLEAAAAEDPAHVQAFLYLGIVYLQLNRMDDAISVYERILPRGGGESARIAYNLGNACFTKGEAALARRYYSEAIKADPAFSSAYLNRANTLVKTGELEAAVSDYETYLSMETASPKRERITRLVAFIKDEISTAEARRIAAEEAALADAERRKKLLLEVSESLQSAAGDSQGLSAGFEDVQDYAGEFELE